ncbi:O-antigen ligase family protein [Winogradskyella sp. PE311]|uniref:O-antigen ligase family protein n=1 Tax=Winogradskyella sp. PE311 TaxID=3366943 RepID=UPI00397F5F1A
MKRFLNLKPINSLFVVGFFLFSISLLLPLNLRNIPTFIFVVVILLLSRKLRFNKTLVINSLVFFIMLVSLTYSSDIDFGLKKIVVLIPILVMPFCFFLIKKSFNIRQYQLLFYKSFFYSTVIFLVGVFIHNYINGYFNETIFVHYPQRMNIGYGKYSIHPIYISIYISIAIIFSIPILKQTKHKLKQILIILCVLFMSIILLMLARKGPIIITFIIILGYFLFNNNKKRIKLLLPLLLLLMIFIGYSIPPLRIRFIDLINVIFDKNYSLLGSTTMRLYIFECSTEIISNNFMIGVGIGDVKQALNDCYLSNEEVFKGKYFNSHNQFLSVSLASGFVGLLAFLTMFYHNIKIAIKNKSFVHTSITILFITIMFTENILERQDGVMLFSFFINFFAFQKIEQKTSE